MKIEIWETDWHRDAGEGYIYDEIFTDFNSALNTVRKLYDDNNFASIEILNKENEALYCRDDESEEFYFDNEKISLVGEEIVSEYINNWVNHKEQTFKGDLLYCKEDNVYVAIDNTSGNCWVEEFSSEKEVWDWLLEKDLEMGDLGNEI